MPPTKSEKTLQTSQIESGVFGPASLVGGQPNQARRDFFDAFAFVLCIAVGLTAFYILTLWGFH